MFYSKFKHGGDIKGLAEHANYEENELIDFSTNINSLGPPAWVKEEIHKELDRLSLYPNPRANLFRETCSKVLNQAYEKIVVGNGANELIYLLPRLKMIKRVVLTPPCYIDYARAAHAALKQIIECPLETPNFEFDLQSLSQNVSPGDLVMVGHPNNPSSSLLPFNETLELISKHPQVLFAIDESFIEFAGLEHSFINVNLANLIIIRSMTKFYAIPGLRLGYLVADPIITQELDTLLPDWSVNRLAEHVGSKLIVDEEYKKNSFQMNLKRREKLYHDLNKIKAFKVYPSTSNYFLIEVNSEIIDLETLLTKLFKEYKIAVRLCHNYTGLSDSYFRVAVKDEANNQLLIKALNELLP